MDSLAIFDATDEELISWLKYAPSPSDRDSIMQELEERNVGGSYPRKRTAKYAQNYISNP